MDEKRLNKLRRFSHPLIALSLSILFIWILDSALRFTLLTVLLTPLPQLSLLIPFAAAFESLISTNSLDRSGISKTAVRIRELVLIILLSLVLLMLWGGYLQRGDFSPLKGDVIYGFIITILAWVLTVRIHSLLKDREAFLKILIGKKGRKKLQEAAHGANVEAGKSEEAVKKVKRTAGIFAVIASLLYIIVMTTSASVPTGFTRLLIAQLVLSFWVSMICRGYIMEESVLAAGSLPPKRSLKRRFRASIVFAALIVLLSLPIAGSQSVLPPSLIDQVMRRISDAMGQEIDEEFDASQLFDRERSRDERDLGGESQAVFAAAGEGQQLIRRIVSIVGYVLLVALAIGFLIFLLGPVFSKEFRSKLKGFSIGRGLQKLADGIQNAFKALLQSIKEFLSSSRRAVQEAGKVMQNIRENVGLFQRRSSKSAEDKSAAARKEINRLLKTYAKLIKWGSRGGEEYSAWMGPLNYNLRLAELNPDRKDALVSIGELFEHLVYGPEEPQKELIEKYTELVNTVTRERSASPAAAK
jgi:hypothetical protein